LGRRRPLRQGLGLPGVLIALTRGLGEGVQAGLFDPEGAPAFGALPGSRRELMTSSALPGSTLLAGPLSYEQRLKSRLLTRMRSCTLPSRSRGHGTPGPNSAGAGGWSGVHRGRTSSGAPKSPTRLGARLVVLSGCNTGKPVFESSFANASLVGPFCSPGQSVSRRLDHRRPVHCYLMGGFTPIWVEDRTPEQPWSRRSATPYEVWECRDAFVGRVSIVGNGEETMERGGGLWWQDGVSVPAALNAKQRESLIQRVSKVLKTDLDPAFPVIAGGAVSECRGALPETESMRLNLSNGWTL